MTRRRAPVSPPVALTVAGSDSGGGAGIQADLKTMESHGVFGTSVVTAVTAQNTRGVERSHVLPVAEIEAQWRAVRDDFDLGAVKTGMLATDPVIDLVTDRAAALDAPLVVDPVMVAASGDRLLDADAEAAYADLVGEATLVTPNADEAAVLTGVEPTDRGTAREAGEALLAMGADAVLVKGGHVGTDADTVVDDFTGPTPPVPARCTARRWRRPSTSRRRRRVPRAAGRRRRRWPGDPNVRTPTDRHRRHPRLRLYFVERRRRSSRTRGDARIRRRSGDGVHGAGGPLRPGRG